MHPLINQELARQHQEMLLREATRERMSRDMYKWTKLLSVRSSTLPYAPSIEPDFSAIRRDLRSLLFKWSPELGKIDGEAVIDTFIYSLKTRLGHNKRCKETRVMF